MSKPNGESNHGGNSSSSTERWNEYIEKVLSHIKAKEAKEVVKEELIHHLEDSQHYYEQSGYSEAEAVTKAIEEMGNPVTLGRDMQRIHKPKIDVGLLGLFVLILGFSNVPMYFLSWHYFSNKVIFSIGAIIIVMALMLFDYRKLERYWAYIYTLPILLLVFTFLFGVEVIGKLYLQIGPFTTNLHFTLLFFIVAWACILHNIAFFHTTLRKIVLYILFWSPIILYVFIPDFPLLTLYFVTIWIMIVYAQIKTNALFTFILTNIGITILPMVLFINNLPYYISMKLESFINPSIYNQPGYIMYEMNRLITEAGWFGKGIASDDIRFLTEAHTNFIFIYIVHVFGWLVGVSVVLLMLALAFRMGKTALKTHDFFGQCIVIGGTTVFTLATMWNVLMTIGYMPYAGFSLPFISYGSSLLVFYSAVIGLILSVYRRKDLINSRARNKASAS